MVLLSALRRPAPYAKQSPPFNFDKLRKRSKTTNHDWFDEESNNPFLTPIISDRRHLSTPPDSQCMHPNSMTEKIHTCCGSTQVALTGLAALYIVISRWRWPRLRACSAWRGCTRADQRCNLLIRKRSDIRGRGCLSFARQYQLCAQP